MFQDLVCQQVVLTDLGEFNLPRELGAIGEIRPLAIKEILQIVFRRDEFDNMRQDFIVPKFLGGGNPVVAIQHIKFILDLIELHGRQGMPLAQSRFDALQPFRRNSSASTGNGCQNPDSAPHCRRSGSRELSVHPVSGCRKRLLSPDRALKLFTAAAESATVDPATGPTSGAGYISRT